MSKKKPPELDIPPIPEELRYIWKLYCDVRTRNGLEYTDMDAFERVTGIKLQAREADLLRSIDAARAKVVAESIQ